MPARSKKHFRNETVYNDNNRLLFVNGMKVKCKLWDLKESHFADESSVWVVKEK